jgi:hypothetical protein
MSEENVEIARKLADLWNTFMQAELNPPEAAEAAARLVQLFDPQVEQIWNDERTMPDQPQRLRGVEPLERARAWRKRPPRGAAVPFNVVALWDYASGSRSKIETLSTSTVP